MDELISVGKIINFHGIAGEAKAGYTNEQRFKDTKTVYIKNQPYTVERIRFHKNFAIIKFKEISDINDIIGLKGESIFVEKINIEKQLDEEEYLIDDLAGLTVLDDKDDVIGVVDSILSNAGGDLLCIKSQEGKDILIPFVKELVPIVDIKHKKIIVKPIEGLLG